jgi:hypothetical protein
MSILTIDDQWYSVDSKDDKKIKETENMENMENRIKEMENRMKEMETQFEEMQKVMNTMHHENLKLVNRVLEAEIALERAKNYLLRNHIPFPFASSPLHDKFKL